VWVGGVFSHHETKPDLHSEDREEGHWEVGVDHQELIEIHVAIVVTVELVQQL
jgi:hypothetical protein